MIPKLDMRSAQGMPLMVPVSRHQSHDLECPSKNRAEVMYRVGMAPYDLKPSTEERGAVLASSGADFEKVFPGTAAVCQVNEFEKPQKKAQPMLIW